MCLLATTVEQAMRTCWTESRRCFADAELRTQGRDSEFQPRGGVALAGLGAGLLLPQSPSGLIRYIREIGSQESNMYPYIH